MSEVKAKGIDVSYWNGAYLDWKKIKAGGIDFAICRAGYVKNNIDSTFKKNVAGASAAGVALGAYWFSYATTVAEAEQEADYLCDAIEATGVKFTYPICYDYEYDSYDKAAAAGKAPTNALITKMAAAFLARVKKRGFYPSNYTNLDYLGKGFSSLTDTYDTWLAQWGTDKPSKECGLWQYSSTGTISGVSGRFDVNFAFVDYPKLIKKLGLNGLAEKATVSPAISADPMKDELASKDNSATKASTVVNIAIGQIGYKEKASNAYLDLRDANAGSNNWTKYARDLYQAGYYNGNKNGYAWCDVFVDWCFFKAFGKTEGELMEYQSGDLGAGCPFSAGYYKAKGRYDRNPKYGDQIFFQQSGSLVHTGLVVEVNDTTVVTVEGNSNNQVKRNTYKKTDSYIAGYGHPNYDVIDAPDSGDDKSAPSADGNKIKDFQTWLNNTFSAGLSVDGEYGAKTKKAAVKAFQKSMNDIYQTTLEVDGAFGPKSAATLKEHYLKYGSTGNLVRVLQGMLYCKGYDPKGFDGIFGNGCKAAVESFQKDNGLSVDGFAGKNTFTALFA